MPDSEVATCGEGLVCSHHLFSVAEKISAGYAADCQGHDENFVGLLKTIFAPFKKEFITLQKKLPEVGERK